MVKIRALAARNGLIWIGGGLRLFGGHPLSLLGSVAAGLLLVWLPSTIPWVGPIIGAVLAPIAALGLIAACRAADAGRIPGVAVYAEGLIDPQARRHLLMLGVIYALIMLPLIAIMQATGMDQAIRIVPGPDQQPRIETHAGLLALRIALSTPILMAMWLAPPLVSWQHLTAPKAMFYSFFACWRNRRPLLTFIAGAFGAGSLATAALAAIVSLLVPDRGVATLLIAPLLLALLAVVQGGIFRMYTQIVEDSAADQGIAA
ncbi:MAG TPA: BPSS1780 family membrane protein [Burkholderiaceae bacterium]|nr:BPSS1780 family membrane protein [Burkholderiaceae bacterium]